MFSSPFPDFVCLGRSIYLQKDSSPRRNIQSVDNQTTTPDYVILFTWVAARPQHILKYVKVYSQRFPNARVMILTTSLQEMIMQSFIADRPRLAAALQVVESTPNTNVLIHTFSNGGAYRATQFLLEYSEQFKRLFNPQAMILDSNPGKGTFRRSVAAITASLPKQFFIQALGVMIAYLALALALLYTARKVFHKDDIITKTRQRLNDPHIISATCPRTYLYSEADDVVWWEDVEEHALQARQRGWQVDCVKFSHSSHVNHPREDATRYWNTIRFAWETGIQQSSRSL